MTHAPRWNLWTAIELDPIPAQIASYLHPSATIYNQGFEKMSLPDQYFDMAIGNVPFGSYSVFEPRYDGLLIHNHFISKSIDLVRDGGLIALITSTGTLDSPGNEEFSLNYSLA
jgi:adenine-specific DNA methylase